MIQLWAATLPLAFGGQWHLDAASESLPVIRLCSAVAERTPAVTNSAATSEGCHSGPCMLRHM